MSGLERNEAIAKAIIRKCQAEQKEVNWYYTGGVLVNGKKIPFYDIYTVDVHRDFVSNYTDVMTLEVIMEARSFYTAVVENLDKLEVYFIKRQMAENSFCFVSGGDYEMDIYKAILHNPPKQGLGAGADEVNVMENPDLAVVTARFQLIDKDALDLKLANFSGFMEMTDPSQALAMILDGTGEDYNLDGVHMVPADVTVPRQIIVPQGLTVKDMAQYFQKEYGIYNLGIGSYIFENEYGKFWWVYPLFNNDRYKREYYKMTIVVVSKRFDPMGIPRTYVCHDGHLTLYTVDETSLLDNKPSDQLNLGTGIQVRNAQENRGPNVNEVGPNKQYMDGSNGVSTFNVVERSDSIKNIVPVYENTNNMAKLISSVAGNAGTYLTVQWKFANAEMIPPGCPTKIIYLDGKELKELYGTVHEYHAISVKQGITAQQLPYNCTVLMRIYVTPNPQVSV